MGPIQSRIRENLTSAFQPVHLEVDNESFKHSVPRGSETHFRVVIVSDRFCGLSRLQRQRLVNEALSAELKNGVHALTQRCLTSDEWAEQGARNFQSPECLGGSKSDKR